MNINTVTSYNTLKTNNSNQKKNQSFGSAAGFVSQSLRFLSVNESIGATLVDFFSMALPRTIVDSTRGLDAGIETGIRENSGTVNHVMIGTIGGLAAYALAPQFNKNYAVRSHAIFANNETIDILGRIWHEDFSKYKNSSDKTAQQKAFYKSAFERMSGLNSIDGDTANWVKLKPQTIETLTKILVDLSNERDLRAKRIPKEKLEYLKTLIISDTGAEKSFKLVSKDNSKTVEFAITSFLDDLFALGRAFTKTNVARAFEESIDNFDANKFIKDLKGLKMRSTFLALGISSAIGASVQPFNRWLTKKRTGSDGFVGVANNPNVTDKKADASSKFIAAKCLAAASILGLCLGSISTNIKEIPNKLQFKGKIPILSHFKLVYGFTIASRFLAARSSDELREACFKDFLGFVNWLILGGFVSKGIATMLDGKGLLNSSANTSQKGFLNWLKNKSLKTVDEVLQSELVKNGVQTVKDGKAVPYKELLNKAKSLKMTDTLKKIKYLNIAQAAGYIYSGVVLGYLIPKLNIKMTEYNNRKKEILAEKNVNIPTQAEVKNGSENKPVGESTKVVFATFMKQLNIN